MADKKTDPARAEANAHEKEIAAQEARAAVEAAAQTPEDKRVAKAEAAADDARAEAVAAREAADADRPAMTAGEARMVLAPDPDMPASDHMAQKFGNDPANPKPAPGLADAEARVRLTRITPDLPEPAVIMVPDAMVGDYLRAGWSRS